MHKLLNADRRILHCTNVPRRPLDFLAHPEMIPGAVRIPPHEIAEETASFPRDQNSVIYCTGGDDKTSEMVLGKARALHFTRGEDTERRPGSIWKEKGFPVEAYTGQFHLDTTH